MASLKQRLEALEQAAPAEGAPLPSEIWLTGPAGSGCTPVLLWRRDASQPHHAGPEHAQA